MHRFVSKDDVPLFLLNHPNEFRLATFSRGNEGGERLHAVRYVLLGVPHQVFDLLDLLQLLLDHPSYLELHLSKPNLDLVTLNLRKYSADLGVEQSEFSSGLQVCNEAPGESHRKMSDSRTFSGVQMSKALQRLWPQAMESGSVKASRQTEH